MSLGFLGIQFGFALQNGNASRILGIFGAEVEHLSWFWLAAPLTGMIVQPIIGHYSDHTWTVPRAKKTLLLVLAQSLLPLRLIFMPNADMLVSLLPPLYVGAGILMIMDASFNVSMEPFRALVADLLPSDQRTLGFSIQTFLIGIGAVIGSWFPYIFAEFFGVAKTCKHQVKFHSTLPFILHWSICFSDCHCMDGYYDEGVSSGKICDRIKISRKRDCRSSLILLTCPKP